MAGTNEELIQELVRDGYLKTPRLIEAFKKIDRKDFVPREYQSEAYGNYPLPIGFGQTISQPLTVAFMLELLEPQPGEKILDVGTGSSWVAGLLAYVVGEKGRVVSVERIPELTKMARRNLSKYDFIKSGRVLLMVGDGSKGYADRAPYDKIIVGAAVQAAEIRRSSNERRRTAASAENIPDEWKKQLKVGGRIVAPVGQSIVVLDKISEKKFEEKEYFGFSFVPLVSN